MDLMAAIARTSCSFSCVLHPFTVQRLQKPNISSCYSHTNNLNQNVTTDLEETKQIHARMIKTNFTHTQPIPINFLPIHSSSPAAFNFIITSYIKNHVPEEALHMYAFMRKSDTNYVDNFNAPSLLKACGQLSWIHHGKEIHGIVLKIGLDWDVFVQNALIQMYTRCTNMESAYKVFVKMPERDVVSWSTMISSCSRNKCYDEALNLIKEMHALKVKPSEIAVINMVNLFADLADSNMARPMHGYVVKHYDPSGSNSVPLTTSVIDMYAKSGCINYARNLFDRLTSKSIVTWSTMIAGHIRSREIEKAAKLFLEMRRQNIIPNEITMLSMVLECGFTRSLELGKELHAYLFRNGLAISSTMETALVDMYGKCGDMKNARTLFNVTSNRDLMMWTAMISGYAQKKCVNQAFDIFVQMRNNGTEPNKITLTSLLAATAEVGALDLGKWIHACIEKMGAVSDVILETSLIEMYAKCGDIEQAQQVFNRASTRDIGMWNAMIGGLAMHGCGEEALKMFYKLETSEIKPNDITFIEVLHGCSHAGLVREGKRLFDKMIPDFGMVPKVEHFGCMVDLLGRAGMLDEAHDMIKSMSMNPNTVVWGSLLAACKLHRNLNLAELVAKQLLEIEPHNCGYSILMSNIYAAAKRWTDVAGIRKSMKKEGIKKEPGISSIEMNGTLHEFLMGDRSHPQTKEILEKLDEMNNKLKHAGYVADKSVVVLNIDEEEKETALTYHSEKLAMAFGLINTAPGIPIRIVKNLRVCEDCHSATKLLSKIYERLIIVRDRNRFHHFSEGSCSCGDYW